MAKIKVLELAREVGMEDDKLLRKLKGMGVKVKGKATEEAEKVAPTIDEKVIERDAQKEVVEKRIKPTVIRRRTRMLEPKAEELQTAESPVTTAPIVPETTVQAPVIEQKVEFTEEVVERVETERPAKPQPRVEKEDIKIPGTEELRAEVPETEIFAKATPEIQQQTEPEAVKEQALSFIEEVREKREEEISVPETVAPQVKDLPIPPEELSVIKKEIAEEERLVAISPKKKFPAKKRRVIEERILMEEPLEEESFDIEKPEEIYFRPPKQTKKKPSLKTAIKKTEVTLPKPIKRIIRIAEVISVSDLAKRMGVKGGELIRKLMDLGVMVNINQVIDADIASLVANEFGYEVEKISLEHEDLLARKEDLPEQLKPRPPVVTVMGHVDHGKTMLLDAIRKTNVVEGEAGGITQHIGAYDVELENGHVVFIDTPGHEAFTAMRARGAQVTDIVVLVVAADDGVMPQTKEAIDHARAANVPIVVAINKIDKPTANPDKVKKELAELGLIPEQWGGSTLFAEVSAKQKTGIKELLELILLQAEILELRANPDKPARGVIIEAKLDKGRGPVATVIVQEGTLRIGDPFIAGAHYGKVRAMLNDRGQKISEAGPSKPVEVIGFTDVPEAGETLIVVQDERMARQISLYRQEKARARELSKLSKVSLEELYEKIRRGEVKELNVIIKADVQGSIEAMKEALKKLSSEAVKVNVLHDAVGGITETDVNLASASNAIIIGFNVRPTSKAQVLAERERVDIRTYSIIYDAISDIKKALEGLLEPTYREHVLGRAQVLQLFNIRKVGTVAGSLILNGKVVRGSHARILRDNVVVYEGRISSLKHFKEDMRDCTEGMECGIAIENFNDIKPGDIIESYEIEEVHPHLS